MSASWSLSARTLILSLQSKFWAEQNKCGGNIENLCSIFQKNKSLKNQKIYPTRGFSNKVPPLHFTRNVEHKRQRTSIIKPMPTISKELFTLWRRIDDGHVIPADQWRKVWLVNKGRLQKLISFSIRTRVILLLTASYSQRLWKRITSRVVNWLAGVKSSRQHRVLFLRY